MHAQRTILFRAGAVILGLCLAGLTVEAAIRFFHLSSDARFIAAHPHYGVSNIPGAEGWYVKGEVRQYVVINGRGLRDRDRWSDGGGVLLLGDSFIAAFQVPLESTCQEVGERLLSQAAGRPVEVTAAACNGWGTVNQMAFLRHEGFSYEPKAVVVALFPENDLLDNMGIPPAACPWPPAPVPKPPLLLPGFLRQAAGRPGSVRAERALVRGLFHLWHATPTEIQNRMWKRLAEVVGAMKDSVEAHDAAFGALIVPGRLALYPDEVTRLVRRQPMLSRCCAPPTSILRCPAFVWRPFWTPCRCPVSILGPHSGKPPTPAPTRSSRRKVTGRLRATGWRQRDSALW
ncbi:MAG: SGNH/GDSL hydrolase family protein [Candidatus Eisenbacteria bacterium]|nr:SGNH/GDSL hydrolase family protein [Candidatus Eisenbacteria bacterium]